MEHRLYAGQFVRYVASEGAKYPRRRYPAIIVHVEDESSGVVNLTVFNDVVPSGSISRVRVPYSKEHQPGSWHYPEAQLDGIEGVNLEL